MLEAIEQIGNRLVSELLAALAPVGREEDVQEDVQRNEEGAALPPDSATPVPHDLIPVPSPGEEEDLPSPRHKMNDEGEEAAPLVLRALAPDSATPVPHDLIPVCCIYWFVHVNWFVHVKTHVRKNSRLCCSTH